MYSSTKKDKRNGIIGTILFHCLLLTSFFFLGLSYQDPPPEEQGINIDFGFSDSGNKNIESNNENTKNTTSEKSKKETTNIDNINTQTITEAPTIEEPIEEK